MQYCNGRDGPLDPSQVTWLGYVSVQEPASRSRIRCCLAEDNAILRKRFFFSYGFLAPSFKELPCALTCFSSLVFLKQQMHSAALLEVNEMLG